MIPPGPQVAIKILDKEKIQKQNMGSQIKKEVRRLRLPDPRLGWTSLQRLLSSVPSRSRS